MASNKAKPESLGQVKARLRAANPGMSQAQVTQNAFEEARRQSAERNRNYIESLGS